MANIINGTDTGSGGLITTGDSSDELQIQTAETTAITITSGQQSAFIAGTAAAPAVTTTGDLNTGIFFSAADTLVVTTGGTAAVTVDSGQRTKFPTTIGVGGATPSTSGAGITFPATQSASSDANTLDDYEEGTFTPSVGGTATYNATFTVGFYRKIGRQVTLNFSVQISSLGTGNADRIINAPFACSSAINECAGCIGYHDGLATSVVFIAPYIQVNTTVVGIVSKTAASTAVSYNPIFAASSGRIWATVTYFVD